MPGIDNFQRDFEVVTLVFDFEQIGRAPQFRQGVYDGLVGRLGLDEGG